MARRSTHRVGRMAMRRGYSDYPGLKTTFIFRPRFWDVRSLLSGKRATRSRIWKSANEFSSLGVLEDLYITVQRGAYDSLESIQTIPAIIEAPVAQGQPLAELTVNLNGETLLSEPLRALADNPTGSFWASATVDPVKSGTRGS